jgi:UDP-glucose 4-epimerase
VEKILCEYSSLSNTNIVSLRYFNPVGANSTGYLMDNPKNPTNLMPLLMQAADPSVKKKILIYGDDFETADGTGVRDYIHIDDLVEGHLSAIQYLETFSRKNTNKGIFEAYNLGTGTGYSVFQLKEMVESIANTKIAYEIVGRRTGDVGSCYANVESAIKNLKWKAKLGLKHMCKSSWDAYCKNSENK